jgi:serpin B
MRDAFSANHEDFSCMTDEVKLKIDAVVHKAFIRVDEEGTEAAAATGVSVGVTSMPPPEEIVEMKIDRPFLFVIHDTKTGAVLFLGRVVNPRA